MTRSLAEALQDSSVLKALGKSPGTFKFKEAPEAIVSMIHFPPHAILQMKYYSSPIVKAGIPMNIPFNGAVYDVLQVLATSINFTYKQVIPANKMWGSPLPGGNWTGMMGQVSRKEADLALGPFTVIKSRFEAVDMSIPFYFDSLAMIVARGTASIDPWAFILPLTPLVWSVFFAVLIGVCLFHFILESRYHPKATWLKQFGSVVFEYMQPPLDHALNRTTWRNWQLPLIGAWIVVSLLLNSSYSGNLRSLMALQHIPHPIQTLRDLIDDSSRKIIIQPGSAYLNTVKKIPFGDIREMNDVGESGRYEYRMMKDFPMHREVVRRGGVQIISKTMSIFFRAMIFSETGRCDYYVAKETFFFFMTSMIVQKDSPLTPAINDKMSRIVESGLYNYWLHQQIDNVTACLNPPMKVTLSDPMSFQNIWGVAVIWAVGIILSILAFVLEKIFNHL